MQVGVLTAFFGGALALLSPCGALLLPGFFASRVTSRAGLLLHGFVFYLGLLLTLLPLGIGVGALGTIFVEHREAVVAAVAIMLVVLGALHALGLGFDLGRLLPQSVRQAAHGSGAGSGGLSPRVGAVPVALPMVGSDGGRADGNGADGDGSDGGRADGGTAEGRTPTGAPLRPIGLGRTAVLGAVGGVAGFCAGPILGAVLSLAFGQGSVVAAGVLLAVYGAGMVVPLVLIAALWGMLGARGRGFLRGRSFQVAGRTFHTTTVLTGLLIMALGVLFWFTKGLVTMPSLVPTELLTRWQVASTALNNTAVQILVILIAGAVALALWWRWDRRRAQRTHSTEEQCPEDS